MPRTKLDVLTPSQQRAELNRVIKMAMAANDIDSDAMLAAMIGMSTQAFSRRKLQGNWKYEELCRLVRALKLDVSQVARMMGVKEWRVA